MQRRRPAFVRMLAVAVLGGLGASPAPVAAIPLSIPEVAKLCAGATDPLDCGRRVEAVQLERFPELATRDGDTLTVNLRDATKEFSDGEARSYALWGYLGRIDALLLYTVSGETLGFKLLLRGSGAQADLPNEPVLSPDAELLATADFCARGCENAIAVWRIERDSLRKDRFFRPRGQWQDVGLSWKDGSTLIVERRAEGGSTTFAFEIRLTDPGWLRMQYR